MSATLKNLPWTVRGCGNPDHGPGWDCHRVEDSTGARLLQSVTREVAERYASIPALESELARLRAFAASFAETAEAAVRHHETKGQGGQQVPFHGDFAHLPPSSVSVLRKLAQSAREALGTEPKQS